MKVAFILILSAVVFICACGGASELVIERSETETDEISVTEVSSSPAMISVYICGAVLRPGVYELEEGSRILDAVAAAGGFTEGVDERYINLAQVLTDGQQITVFTEEELAEGLDEIISGATEDDGIVNINTASLDELMTLPGIGETRAKAIISYREQNGGFSEKEDIKNISGIGDKIYEQLSDLIEV